MSGRGKREKGNSKTFNLNDRRIVAEAVMMTA